MTHPYSGLVSYTAFRRRIKPGTKVRIVNKAWPRLNREVRVVRTQTNAFTSPGTNPKGEPVAESWVWWPKAKYATMLDDNTVALGDETVPEPWLIITILEDA